MNLTFNNFQFNFHSTIACSLV